MIAKRKTWEGVPRIMAPSVLGAAPKKPFLYQIPVLGKRPVHFYCENLPKEIVMDENGLLTGVPCEGSFEIKFAAENEEGRAEKTVRLEVKENEFARTPMMGFCSWNAFSCNVTEEDIRKTAEQLKQLGLSEYGYNYINIDSSWQGFYDEETNAIMPNEKFPDMEGLCDSLHAMGFRVGIYSTPMIHAWGCPEDREWLPGCTCGERDYRFADTMDGIGMEHRERQNADQWARWGIDHLKYDWYPCDTFNADLMRQALDESKRDFTFCVTVQANILYADYWKRHCNAWRNNVDSNGTWENLVRRLVDSTKWLPHIGGGHYLDLDMLDIGKMDLFTCQLTENEKMVAYASRAVLLSPIQISCHMDSLTEFELDLLCNEEVIALHQDGLMRAPKLFSEENLFYIYQRELQNGDMALAFFNLSDEAVSGTWNLSETCEVRDVWKMETVGKMEKLKYDLEAHSCYVVRVKRI